jgi:large subunit ribosomal protein L15
MKLNELRDNPGATKARKRVGRGPGSGLGKTSGSGHKGQKARSGVAINGYEGGQMPIYRRLPKRGFSKPNARVYKEVNIGRLQRAIDEQRLDPAQPVDATALKQAGIIKHSRDGVRLLAKGELKAKLDVTVAGASKAAVEAVEKAGGKITITEPRPAATAEE